MSRLFDDAAQQYLSNANGIATNAPATLAAWFRSDDTTILQCMIGLFNGGDYFYLQAAGTDAQKIYAAAGDNPNFETAATTAGYNANTWHHACAVFASSTSRSAYLDGGSKGTNVNFCNPTGLDTTHIGTTWGAGGNHFSGRIAEAAIWNVALTDDEVLALAGGVSPTRIRPGSIQAYWPLYGTASPEPDYRGTYNMTLNNGPTQADHAPVQVPFGHGISWIESTTEVARIPRHPAAYFDGPTIF